MYVKWEFLILTPAHDCNHDNSEKNPKARQKSFRSGCHANILTYISDNANWISTDDWALKCSSMWAIMALSLSHINLVSIITGFNLYMFQLVPWFGYHGFNVWPRRLSTKTEGNKKNKNKKKNAYIPKSPCLLSRRYCAYIKLTSCDGATVYNDPIYLHQTDEP